MATQSLNFRVGSAMPPSFLLPVHMTYVLATGDCSYVQFLHKQALKSVMNEIAIEL